MIPQMMRLSILWRVKVGNSEYMTTPTILERGRHPSPRAIFYVPKDPQNGTRPLYRHIATNGDHMDSTSLRENGYNLEGPLAHPYVGSSPGLSPIRRFLKNNPRDRATASDIEGFNDSGYVLEDVNLGYGYALQRGFLESSAGGIKVKSNLAAGGAIWVWEWKHPDPQINGGKPMQFVNVHDLGRQIQSAVFFNGVDGESHNPTEAGDDGISISPTVSCPDSSSPLYCHGSPVVLANNRDQGVEKIHETLGIPLESVVKQPLPNPPGGYRFPFLGDQDTPVIYQDFRLGKKLTLNYRGLGPVVQYETILHTPISLPNTPNPLPFSRVEIPTGYLPGNFTQFYTYDAATDNLRVVNLCRWPAFCPPDPNCSNSASDPDTEPDPYHQYQYRFRTNYGGVIIATGDNNFAQGVFGVRNTVVRNNARGSVDLFGLWNLRCVNSPNGPSDNNTVKWNAEYRNRAPNNLINPIPVGQHTYRTWIVTGTTAQVRQKMHELYQYLLTHPTEPI